MSEMLSLTSRALDVDDGVSAERRQRDAATRCTTVGCSLLAEPRDGSSATGSDRCCDYCPTSHTWECLSRHTADERAAALRHQATHDTTGDEQSSSAAPVEPPHEPSAVSRARFSSTGDDVSPIPVTKAPSTSMGAETATPRVGAVTKAVIQAANGARRANAMFCEHSYFCSRTPRRKPSAGLAGHFSSAEGICVFTAF